MENKAQEILKYFQNEKEEFIVDLQIDFRDIYNFRFRHKNNNPKCIITYGITLEDFEDYSVEQIIEKTEKSGILKIIDTAAENARYLLITYGLKPFTEDC